MHGAAGSMRECTKHSQIQGNEMTMRVYVGTYAKYNAGSLFGKWLNLEGYADKNEFIAACRELHKDEADPELMFQDYEDIPSWMISESHIDDGVWEFMDDCDEFGEDAVKAYADCFGGWDKGQFQERYRGEYASWVDMAEELLDETGQLDELPEWAQPYFDYEAYARDIRLNGDMCESDGHFFWNN